MRSFSLKWIYLLVLSCFFISCSDDSSGESVDGDIDSEASETGEREYDDLLFPDAIKFELASFKDPAVEFRPWVRWWWPGNNVQPEELKREVNLLKDNGFGGAELQAFNAALDPKASKEDMDKRLSYDTPSYYDNLKAMLEEALKVDLPIDLTLGSGWATGGTHVSAEQSMQTLLWAEHIEKGGKKIEIDLSTPDMPVFYDIAEVSAGIGEELSRFMPEKAKLVEVIAAKVAGGARDDDNFNLTDQIKLDKKSVQLITDKVNDNKLSWDAPEGEWIIISFYQAPDGGFPSLAALPELGFVMNHFDSDEVKRNLDHFLGERTGLEKYLGKPVRGIFTDSFELKVERFFASDFFDEFEKRRGYDIRKLLPAVLLPGADNHIFDGSGISTACSYLFDDNDTRLQYDYQQTVSELFIERFVDNAGKWCKDKNLTTRMQNYGLNVDVIQASGVSSIPEAEQLYAGGTELFLKLVSSGAHLYGKNVVSAESLVWAGKDYALTPLRMKAAVDKLFTSGINHVLYHGFPYTISEGYTDLGWAAFSSPFSGAGTYSSNISEKSAFWNDMPQFNKYVARTQVALRSGRPSHDLLIYYPYHGFPASFARLKDHEETLFKGRMDGNDYPAPGNILYGLVDTFFGEADFGERGEWLLSLWPRLQELGKAGFSWEWINDHRLNELRFEDGKLFVGKLGFKSLVIYKTKTMPVEIVQLLQELAQKGAPIVFVGETPQMQPGYFEFDKNDKIVKEQIEKILSANNVKALKEDANFVSKLSELEIKPSVEHGEHSELYFIKRDLDDGKSLVFFRNSGREEIKTEIAIENCESAFWLDSWTGKAFEAEVTNGKISLNLAEFGSAMLLCGEKLEPTEKLVSFSENDEIVEVSPWNLKVGDADEVNIDLDELKDWREIEDLKYVSSVGNYSASFDMQKPASGKVFLQIDKMEGAVSIKINDKDVARLLAPPYACDITEAIKDTTNTIKMTYTPPLLNGLVGKALDGEEGYERFKSRDKTLAPTGITGKVRIRTVK